ARPEGPREPLRRPRRQRLSRRSDRHSLRADAPGDGSWRIPDADPRPLSERLGYPPDRRNQRDARDERREDRDQGPRQGERRGGRAVPAVAYGGAPNQPPQQQM